jgi:predicted RecA/RadA family phage recombinase
MARLGTNAKDGDTGRAEVAITAARFVKQGAAVKGILQCSVAGENAFGVSMWDIANGDAGTYYRDGDVPLEVSAALAIGAEIATDANGKGKAAASTNQILGHLLEASAADGDVVMFRFARGKSIKA